MWEELGIAATADVRAIRKAYAGRLRRLDPDRDPAGFQRLRQAFEAALAEAEGARDRAPAAPREATAENDERAAGARRAAERIAVAEADRPPQPQPESEPADATANAEVAPDPLRIEAGAAMEARRSFGRALAGGDIETAFSRLVEALARGLLGLDEQPEIIAEFMTAAVDHPSLPGERFVVMARQLGWEQPRLAARTADRPLREKVAGRLDAEAWYGGLLARAGPAEPWANYVARQERWLARFLLGRDSYWQVALLVNAPLIDGQLAPYGAFEPWLRDRLDAGRVTWLRARWLRWPPRETLVSLYWALATLVIALPVPLLLAHRLLRHGDSGRRPLDPARLEWWHEMARAAAQRKLPSRMATLRNVLFISIRMMLYTVLAAIGIGVVIAAVLFPPLGIVVVAAGFFLRRKRRPS